MPRPSVFHDPAVCARALTLVAAGRSGPELAQELGTSSSAWDRAIRRAPLDAGYTLARTVAAYPDDLELRAALDRFLVELQGAEPTQARGKKRRRRRVLRSPSSRAPAARHDPPPPRHEPPEIVAELIEPEVIEPEVIEPEPVRGSARRPPRKPAPELPSREEVLALMWQMLKDEKVPVPLRKMAGVAVYGAIVEPGSSRPSLKQLPGSQPDQPRLEGSRGLSRDVWRHVRENIIGPDPDADERAGESYEDDGLAPEEPGLASGE